MAGLRVNGRTGRTGEQNYTVTGREYGTLGKKSGDSQAGSSIKLHRIDSLYLTAIVISSIMYSRSIDRRKGGLICTTSKQVGARHTGANGVGGYGLVRWITRQCAPSVTVLIGTKR